FYNAIIGISDRAEVTGRYNKIKLVPFGEFLPFRDLLRPLGVDAIAAGSVDFTPGTPASIEPILPADLPQALALICYEIIFPGRFDDQVANAHWIVNVTNDAWFGDTTGPHQHFAMAQARAIETGLPVVRVANTGLSGVIDPLGRVLVRSALNQTAVLDLPLPKRLDGVARELPFMPWIGFATLMALLSLILTIVCVKRW
ncbi:MAG: apolipoprotein N-acyltransferase, partial [Pseudomonadota bacterium]